MERSLLPLAKCDSDSMTKLTTLLTSPPTLLLILTPWLKSSCFSLIDQSPNGFSKTPQAILFFADTLLPSLKKSLNSEHCFGS